MLEVRRELGPDFDSALVESFVEEVERRLDRRVEKASKAERNEGYSRLALALGSLGVGVPLSAIAVSAQGLPGLVVTWLGIVGVNAAYALRRRR